MSLADTRRAVAVGHLDTGLDPAHRQFEGHAIHFAAMDPASGRELTRYLLGDRDGHGTATAAQLLAACPGAPCYSARALNGGLVVARILAGLCWLCEQPIRVACLAIGLKARTPVFGPALTALRRRGILPVAAIGNRGAGGAMSPGWYQGLLSVGAVDDKGRVLSCSGSANDPATSACLAPVLLAPGVVLRAAVPGGGEREVSGTSMAAATVAGLAARLLTAHPGASIDRVEDALLATARPPVRGFEHKYTRGIVDVEAAERWLSKGGGRPSTAVDRVGPTPDPLQVHVDPRLLRLCRRAGSKHTVDAVVVWRETADPASLLERIEGRGSRLLNRLPLARALVVNAIPEVLLGLRADPGVEMLHAADIDFPNA